MKSLNDLLKKLKAVDLAGELEQNVIAEFWARYLNLIGRLPKSAQPTPQQLDKVFAEAVQASPGAVRDAVGKLQAQLVQLVLTRKSAITKDDSALA